MSTQVTNQATERNNGDKPGKQKFGLVLQGGGALGAYEVGAVEYLYERGMECAIVTGASAGALNAAALAGATQYPPRVLRKLWEKIAVDGPIPFLPEIPVPLPQWLTRLWFSYMPSLLVPGMYRPRLDVWNLPDWTYVAKPTMGKTLDSLVDWDQVRDPGHMRLTVSASGVEDGTVAYFTNIPADKLPAGSRSTSRYSSAPSTCWPAAASRRASRGPRSRTGPTGTAASPTTPRSSRSSTT